MRQIAFFFCAWILLSPTLIERTTALLQKGLDQKIMPPQVTMRDVPPQVLNLIMKDPAESSMIEPFKEMSSLVPAADQARIRPAATDAFTKKVGPAYQKFHDFPAAKYLPGCRTTIG